MSSLAIFCKNKGFIVSGSDTSSSPIIESLKKQNVKVFLGHNRKNARGIDVLVYTSAISKDNPELQFALDNKKIVLKRTQLLALIEKTHNFSVGVSGCHGKTTATAMLTHIFKTAGKSLTAFIGGEDKIYGNFVYGQNELIYEACEFQRNFLDLSPKIGVILNVDNDHLDTYRDLSDIKGAYKQFISQCVSVINNDDQNARQLAGLSTVTFGVENTSHFMAKNIKETPFISFDLYEYGGKTGRVKINVVGKFNVYNALSAIAVARIHGISTKKCIDGLKNFCGVKRRLEVLGVKKSCVIQADYAHHPREIEKVVSGNTLVVFQSHTYSRTKFLMDEFVDVLKSLDTVILPTYPAREKYDVEGSGYVLYKNILSAKSNCFYAENDDILYEYLDKNYFRYEKILFLGAGDVYNKAEKYLKKPQ